MYTLVLIGFVGGLITGISPCILPVLPVIFFSGAQNARNDDSAADTGDEGGGVATVTRTRSLAETLRPYRVIAGLVVSFSLVTLIGSALLSVLHLPQDTIRWAGLVVLALIGFGLIFPAFEQLLERPFSRLPQRPIAQGKSGFGLGLEKLIRQLLTDAHPGIELPAPTEVKDTTPTVSTTPETYLAVGKVVNYGRGGPYAPGTTLFTYPPTLPEDSFGLQGRWTLDHQGATAAGPDSSIELDYHAKNVYLVVGGTGTVTVTQDGTSRRIPVSGPPTLHQIVAAGHNARGRLQVTPDEGLQVFSFTYG